MTAVSQRHKQTDGQTDREPQLVSLTHAQETEQVTWRRTLHFLRHARHDIEMRPIQCKKLLQEKNWHKKICRTSRRAFRCASYLCKSTCKNLLHKLLERVSGVCTVKRPRISVNRPCAEWVVITTLTPVLLLLLSDWLVLLSTKTVSV